jgi:hypothetical protein
MATFDNFLKTLESDLIGFAEKSLNAYKTQAIQDGNTFINKSKADLERWTMLLASGDLTCDDFQWLVKGKKDLAELEALKLAGLGKAALEKFINGLIDTIVSTAFKVFL